MGKTSRSQLYSKPDPSIRPPIISNGNTGSKDKHNSNSTSSNKLNALTYPIVILIIIIVAYVWQSRVDGEIQNISNVDINTLKQHLFGDLPHLFYCDRGKTAKKKDIIPKAFVDLIWF